MTSIIPATNKPNMNTIVHDLARYKERAFAAGLVQLVKSMMDTCIIRIDRIRVLDCFQSASGEVVFVMPSPGHLPPAIICPITAEISNCHITHRMEGSNDTYYPLTVMFDSEDRSREFWSEVNNFYYCIWQERLPR